MTRTILGHHALAYFLGLGIAYCIGWTFSKWAREPTPSTRSNAA